MLRETGCDAVMVGRAARGNPWIFRRISEALSGSGDPDTMADARKPDVEEMKKMILRHAQMVVDQDGENLAMRKMRKHVAWYTVGCRRASKLRGMSNTIATMEDLRNLLTLLEP